jgi:hypothetical protein
MSSIDTCIKFHYRPCPELILSDCRNQIEALQNLTRLASLDALSNSAQKLRLGMMEYRLHRLADALFLPA